MKYLIKYGFFTVIYLILTWFMSDNMGCVLEGNSTCLFEFAIRYIIFMGLMAVYDIWIKDKLFKNKKVK